MYGPFDSTAVKNYQAGCCIDDTLVTPQFDCSTETYCPTEVSGSKITFDTSNIAWKADLDKFYNNADYMTTQWTDVEDPNFIVWMRTAGLPNFRKLYGVINEDLQSGIYQLVINSAYDVASFNGKKSFVLATTNSLGGQNYFMAIAYIVVGSLCIVFSVIFFGAFMSRKTAQ